ncbi:hypothetical protein [Psittacicella gerlachiana]|uniref:Uncharacterized protein n=1 Tax=Psittacicella gerlachiana TaxID=2028574 RepID=A0A3A1YEP5_9GAMM|nr:hypothetical protein [Psittacicella gerlachiana]RIY36021.1 hypothetical protein CKF59_03095 [Psittacicella gerlachiana]
MLHKHDHVHHTNCSCNHHEIYIPFFFLENPQQALNISKKWELTEHQALIDLHTYCQNYNLNFASTFGQILAKVILRIEIQEHQAVQEYLIDCLGYANFSPSAIIAHYNPVGLSDTAQNLFEFANSFNAIINEYKLTLPTTTPKLILESLDHFSQGVKLLVEDLKVYLQIVNTYLETLEDSPVVKLIQNAIFDISSRFKVENFSSSVNYNLLLELIPELTLYGKKTINYPTYRNNNSGLMFDSIFEILISIPTK